MKLSIVDLTPEAFARYGTALEMPNRETDSTGLGYEWWDETALLEGDARPYAIGYLHLEPAELRFDWAERHMRSMELLIPAGGDCLVYVGPPDHLDEPAQMPPLERFEVFRVREGQGVLVGPGVWHGAPMALDGRLSVFVLLHQDTGEVDSTIVRFKETPVTVER